MPNDVTNRWSVSTDLQFGPDERQNLLLAFRERPQVNINLLLFDGLGHSLLRVSRMHGPAHVLRLECYNIVSKHVYTPVNVRTQVEFL